VQKWVANVAGLLEDTEQEEMQTLVEIRLSKLHFGAPHFAMPSLENMLGEHPLFEHLSDEELRTEVHPPPPFPPYLMPLGNLWHIRNSATLRPEAEF
jgi:hypothetical protein